MISKEQIQQLKHRIGGDENQMLSIYAHVNPARPNNHPKAVSLRARETLKQLGMPRELTDAVLAHLSTETKESRTVAIFAGADHFEVIEVSVDLPVVDPTTGHVEARWGGPHLTPLLLALDENERYGIVFIDQERWRFFEVFLGEIEEVAQVFHPLVPEEIERLAVIDRLTPEALAVRDDTRKDGSPRHVLAWTHRFYKDVGTRIDRLVTARGIDRLMLMGPDREAHLLEALLPRNLRAKVVARLSSLPTPNASAHEVLRRVQPEIERVESAKELELLAHIRERGVWGIDETLEILQHGQVYAVAAPWGADTMVFVDKATGYVHRSLDRVKAAATPNANGSIQERPLRDVLPDLAVAYAARLEFVRGRARELLLREMGGLAGLKRW